MSNLTDADLVERAVRGAHTGRRVGVRWAHVRDTFCVGSTTAAALCVRFGLDPDEQVGAHEPPDMQDYDDE